MSENVKDILVLSGGGIKGICHLGGLVALEEKGILKNIKTFAGSSIGAVISLLIVIGYKPSDLFDFILLFDLKKFRSKKILLFEKFGIDDGSNFIIVINQLLKNKEINKCITFEELFTKTKLKLIITACCVNEKKNYYFSHNNYPKLSIITAIRMSIAVPIFFTPVTFEDKIFVDGSCIDNYPISLFQDNLDHVIGIYLSNDNQCIKNIDNFEELIINIIQCLFIGINNNTTKNYEKFTVNIQTPCINFLDTSINTTKKFELFKSGYDCVKKYLSS